MKEHIPIALLSLLFAGAVVFVTSMFAFSPAKDSLLVWLIVLLTALTGAGLFSTVVLDYPFPARSRSRTMPSLKER